MPKIPSIPEDMNKLEDRTYEATLENIEVREVETGKWAGRLQAFWRFRLTDEDYLGRVVVDNSPLPFTINWEPIPKDEMRKCFRFVDWAAKLNGGIYPADSEWVDFVNVVKESKVKITTQWDKDWGRPRITDFNVEESL